MPQLQAGEVIENRYEVVRGPFLGGMSEVYEGSDRITTKKVAIKVPRADVSRSEAHHSFDAEHHALDSLRHRNVVELYDTALLPDHSPVLLLEWLPKSLQGLITPESKLAWIDFYSSVGRPLLEALRVAHARKIAHRDLSPKNVRLTDSDEPKITDFGIARHMEKVSIGHTFRGAGSFPYTPPEHDDGLHSFGRDCWSWCAIAASCISGETFATKERMVEAMQQAGAEDIPASVFLRAWSSEAASRYRSASELFADVEAFHRKRLSETGRQFIVPVQFQAGPMNTLCRSTGLSDLDAMKTRLITEFNEVCACSISEDGKEISAVGYDLRLLFGREPTDLQARLILRDASKLGEGRCAQLRNDMVELRGFLFAENRPYFPRGKEAIRELVAFIAAGQQMLTEEEERRREEQLFETTSRSLALRERRLRGASSQIHFRHLRKEGKAYVIQPVDDISPDEVDESALILAQNGRPVLFNVLSVDYDRIRLEYLSGPESLLPARGVLQRNSERDRMQLRKQRMVLDGIRAGLAVSPRLADLLRNPGAARQPEQVGIEVNLRPDIDDIVSRSLGLSDALVVNGPPGTGKTTLIAELIDKYLATFPNRRVLLSSQTHVALDHVLQKLQEKGLGDKLLRISGRSSAKVDDSVRNLLLSSRLADWIAAVEERAFEYVEASAKDLGVDARQLHALVIADELQKKMASRAACLREFEQKKTALTEEVASAAHENSISSPNLQEIERETTTRTDELADLEQQCSLLKTSEDRLRARLLRLGDFGKELAASDQEQIAEWLSAIFTSNEHATFLRLRVSLQSAWLERLGFSRDFEAAILSQARVTAGTCNGLASFPAFYDETFDLCIVDQASKATVAETLIPLYRAKSFILVGDPKQLPPFRDVSGPVQEDWSPEMDRTLLDFMLEGLPGHSLGTLKMQGRMCRGIGDMISTVFYPELTIQSTRADETRKRTIAHTFKSPVTWISTTNTAPKEETLGRGRFRNSTELGVIVEQLAKLNGAMKGRSETCSVAVIAGYAEQVLALKGAVDAHHSELRSLSIQVNTVDAFQGKDADVCIYSVTRSNPQMVLGFQRNKPRLNVALSRARDALLIVGDAAFCRACPGENPFPAVLSYIEAHPGPCSIVDYGKR